MATEFQEGMGVPQSRCEASNNPIVCLVIGGTIVLLLLAIAAGLWIVVKLWAAIALEGDCHSSSRMLKKSASAKTVSREASFVKRISQAGKSMFANDEIRETND